MFLEKSRDNIQKNFLRMEQEFPALVKPVREKLQKCSGDLALAMQYLYTAAPLSDMVNYSFETLLDYAEHGLFLWEQLEGVRALPEELYLNYVLSHRVNEEEILPCRKEFWEQLAPRIQGKQAKDAAIEVNYWCAEEATYQSGDDRTLPALTVYRRGYGRCGEESTFLVNALRSVGIPARQVYVPRWSHCDDNHAWVELWCDGRWYFTGACEPLMILNKGWFTNASSRAMVLHSRIFDGEMPEQAESGQTWEGNCAGKEDGTGTDGEAQERKDGIARYEEEAQERKDGTARYEEEEAVGKEGTVTMLNQLGRYASVKRIQIRVTDECGHPAEGAEVAFQILNYAEYYSGATVRTDRNGVAELLTGLGTLRIQVNRGQDAGAGGPMAEAAGETSAKRAGAVSGGSRAAGEAEKAPVRRSQVAVCDIDTRTASTFEICLKNQEAIAEEWHQTDVIAPVDTPVNRDMPTAEQKLEGDRRLAEANRIRKEKKANWENPERKLFLAQEDPDGLRRAMLESLSEKDQTDCSCAVLEEHLAYALPYRSDWKPELFIPYVLNPRVDYELLRCYRKGISEYFTEEQKAAFRESPALIWQEIQKTVRAYPKYERETIITTPYECLSSGIGSEHSQHILFVAICRTLGIPARLNTEDKAMEYWDGSGFVPVVAAQEKTASLCLTDTEGISWKYFQNWSLARFEDGAFVSLDLSRLEWETQAEQTQMLQFSLLPGEYRVITANRLPNGNLFTFEKEFTLSEGESRTETLRLRKAELGDMLEEIALPDFEVKNAEGGRVSADALTDGGKKILMWLEESREPTEHILNEMLEQQEEFRQYAPSICFMIRSEAAKQDPTLKKALDAFPGISVYYDSFEENIELLGRRMYVDPERLPLILVTNGRKNGIYAASGYNVGTGEMLLRIMREVPEAKQNAD